jgi:hypothetical protein
MDQIDAALADQRRQPHRVDDDFRRVLRARRKREQLAADIRQLAAQPPALARDQGLAARAHDRFRHLDRGALRPAGIQLGDDLQNGGRFGHVR